MKENPVFKFVPQSAIESNRICPTDGYSEDSVGSVTSG